MNKIFLLIVFLLTSCAGIADKNILVFNKIAKNSTVDLCVNNKSNHNYSLTIYAYNDFQKSIRIDKAVEELKNLDTQYKLIAEEVIPNLLLKSFFMAKRYQNIVTNKYKNYDFIFKFNIKEGEEPFDVLNYYEAQGYAQSEDWSDNAFNNLRSAPFQWLRQLPQDLSFIPTSSNGEELVICPKDLCLGLVVPRSNKIIENFSDKDGSSSYGVKENLYEIKADHYREGTIQSFNSIDEFYFLFDILSKSKLALGEHYFEKYFSIPEIDQAKICADFKIKLPSHPDSCFKYQTRTYTKELHGTNLFALDSYSTKHEPTDIDKALYMDAVARDYIEKTTFDIEKSNEGKWTIYKIKVNPDFICKYERNKSELYTK